MALALRGQWRRLCVSGHRKTRIKNTQVTKAVWWNADFLSVYHWGRFGGSCSQGRKGRGGAVTFSARNLLVRLSGFTIRFCHLQICCFDVSSLKQLRTGWWFGTFFIFPYIGKNHPNWLIFFRVVETTNQIKSGIVFQNDFLVWGQVAQPSNQRVVRCGQ